MDEEKPELMQVSTVEFSYQKTSVYYGVQKHHDQVAHTCKIANSAALRCVRCEITRTTHDAASFSNSEVSFATVGHPIDKYLKKTQEYIFFNVRDVTSLCVTFFFINFMIDT